MKKLNWYPPENFNYKESLHSAKRCSTRREKQRLFLPIVNFEACNNE